MTKGHNFVQNMTINDPKSLLYLQIMAIHSAKFQINSIKNVTGVEETTSESARALTPSKWPNQKSKTTCTSSYHKKTIYKLSNESDERCRRSCGDKISDGRKAGRTHGRTRVISIVPLNLRWVTNSSCNFQSYMRIISFKWK